VPLDATHDRAALSCEEPRLTRFLQVQTLEEPQRFLGGVFVAREPSSRRVVGYYALSPYVIARRVLPTDIRRHPSMPRYDPYLAFLLGRLARDITFKGTRLGEFLLISALARALYYAGEIGGIALIVDTVNEKAREFYRRDHFTPIPDEEQKLFITMHDVRVTIERTQ
jgi:GNAT superfamily N-acetyltransferase